MKSQLLVLLFLCALALNSCAPGEDKAPSAPAYFSVTFNAENDSLQDGRLLLLLSKDNDREPRFQVSDGPNTQLVFGIDVDGWAPGKAATFDSTAFGYPIECLADVPAGEYYVQALLLSNCYIAK